MDGEVMTPLIIKTVTEVSDEFFSLTKVKSYKFYLIQKEQVYKLGIRAELFNGELWGEVLELGKSDIDKLIRVLSEKEE
jgi:hypothetical protein